MVNNGKFSPNHVKVVTEAGTVYLMGLVTQAEGDAAAEIARTTSGVTRRGQGLRVREREVDG